MHENATSENPPMTSDPPWRNILPAISGKALILSLAMVTIGRLSVAQSVPLSETDLPVNPVQLGKHDKGSENAEHRVRELAGQDYARRHVATIEMWKDREGSREIVQRAARDPDPEIAGRAKWILRQWRRGALPDTPPEISRLLRDSDSPGAVERLLNRGQFQATVVAVEESAGTINRESINQRITSALLQRYPLYAKLAYENGTAETLLRLIDLVADTDELSLCRIRLMQLLDVPIDESNLLPSSSTMWTDHERAQRTIMLLASTDQLEQALSRAKESGELSYQIDALTLLQRGDEVCDLLHELAMESDFGTPEYSLRWCETLVAATRCGRSEVAEQAIAVLTSVDSESAEAKLTLDMRWKCLAIHGKIKEAIDCFPASAKIRKAKLCLNAARPQLAFEVLGYSLSDVDNQLHTWIDGAVATQVRLETPGLCDSAERLVVLMRLLIATGHNDSAWVIAKHLSEIPAIKDQPRVRDFVLEELLDTRNDHWIPQLAFDKTEKALSRTSLQLIAGTVSGVTDGTFEIVYEAMMSMFPKWSIDQKVAATKRLLEGDFPGSFDRVVDTSRLLNFVITPRVNRLAGMRIIRQRIARGQPLQVTIRANLEIAQMFWRLGQSDAASACLTAMASSGDLEAFLEIAEHSLQVGNLDDAEEVFESVLASLFRLDDSSVALASQSNMSLAGKAMVGLVAIARRRGDEVAQTQREQQLRLMLCGPSTSFNDDVAGYLSELGDKPWIKEIYRSSLSLQLFQPDNAIGLYNAARGYAMATSDDSPEVSARWFDLAMTRLITSDSFRDSAFIALPIYVHRWALEAAINKRDETEARRNVDVLLTLDPVDIDMAERLLPLMRDKGMDELASDTLTRILSKGAKQASTFPLDAMTCNNLAWIAAKNDYDLPLALRLSRQAVDREPESSIYLDTLAEVLFRMDKPGVALVIEEQSIIDDPDQWHLHQQIERFRKAATP